jgi:hypothetical protein
MNVIKALQKSRPVVDFLVAGVKVGRALKCINDAAHIVKPK